MTHLIFREDRCMGCGICASVCVRNAIKIEGNKAMENPDSEFGCFDCGHCMAICPQDGIRLVRYQNQDDKIVPYKNKPMIKYENLMTFLSERRTMRWMTGEPVSQQDFQKLFAAAHLSPSAMNLQDVRFVVLDKDLDKFMLHVKEIVAPMADKYRRIKDFIEYMDDPRTHKYNPMLWEGRQVILAFSRVRANAFIAMSRVEMAAATLGLGGFYSMWMYKAEVQDHERLMDFFPEIPRDMHMNVIYVIGHPKIRYRRTVPRMNTEVHMR